MFGEKGVGDSPTQNWYQVDLLFVGGYLTKFSEQEIIDLPMFRNMQAMDSLYRRGMGQNYLDQSLKGMLEDKGFLGQEDKIVMSFNSNKRILKN